MLSNKTKNIKAIRQTDLKNIDHSFNQFLDLYNFDFINIIHLSEYDVQKYQLNYCTLYNINLFNLVKKIREITNIFISDIGYFNEILNIKTPDQLPILSLCIELIKLMDTENKIKISEFPINLFNKTIIDKINKNELKDTFFIVYNMAIEELYYSSDENKLLIKNINNLTNYNKMKLGNINPISYYKLRSLTLPRGLNSILLFK